MRAPLSATRPPRRRAWLRIFVARCSLPCDPPVGGHSCNGGMIARFHHPVRNEASRHRSAWLKDPFGADGHQPFAERVLRNILPAAEADHSALMLAARIPLPHFSVSSAMSFPKSAGEPTSGVPPRSASRALILGSARAALTSLLSLLTISAGVAFGAQRPDQPLAS